MRARSGRILFTCLVLDLLSLRYAFNDISISLNHTGPMIAGEPYAFQCDLFNVDPSKSVLVIWYNLNKVVYTENIPTTAVNRTSELLITPQKTDNGSQYWCQAQLIGEGSQSYPLMSSEHLNIIVHYKPIINKNKLPSAVPVFRGYPEVLVCEAEGYPKPTITWIYGTDLTDSENFTITESTLGNLYCNASNSAGSSIRRVNIVLKEDYLPLIAGLIAVIVAFVSVIFIFIYSIYYKTAKMGHYSLKDVKLSSQNGNIAQNGKQNHLPMKKLSQSNILA